MRRSERGRCKGRCKGRCSPCCNHALQRCPNRTQVVENIGVLHAALQCAAVRCAAAPPFKGLQQRCSATEKKTVKFRSAALDGDYVMLWGLDGRGACKPEVRGGPPDPIMQINVRVAAIAYVAELPPLPIREHLPPGVQTVLARLKEAAEKRFGPAKEAECAREPA